MYRKSPCIYLFVHVYLRRRNPYGQKTVQVQMRGKGERLSGVTRVTSTITRVLSATGRLETEGGRAAAAALESPPGCERQLAKINDS